jgi:hypothetical protein
MQIGFDVRIPHAEMNDLFTVDLLFVLKLRPHNPKSHQGTDRMPTHQRMDTA